MARKRADIDLDSLLRVNEDTEPKEEPKEEEVLVESEPVKEIKEEELVVVPVKEEPLQTFANKPAQPFNDLKEDAPRGVGGSYYIDATGTRVKR